MRGRVHGGGAELGAVPGWRHLDPLPAAHLHPRPVPRAAQPRTRRGNLHRRGLQGEPALALRTLTIRAVNEPLRSFTVSEEVPIKHYVSIRFLMVKVLVNTLNKEKVPVGALSNFAKVRWQL